MEYNNLILREYYKDSFYAFVRDVFEHYRGVPFKPHYTVQLLCEHIEYNIKGNFEWGIYNLPRGWGKSVIISELAPAWALLREPVERVACYSKKMSEDAKDWHNKTHTALTCDFTSTFIEKNIVSSYNKFVLRTNKGGYRRVASCLASSVGSDITLAIMDDPQGEDHITSQTKRSRLHNFFSNGLLRAIRTVDYSVMDSTKDMQLSSMQKEELEQYNITLALENEVRDQPKNAKARLIVVMQRLFPKDFCNYIEEMIAEMERQGVSKPHTKLAIPAIHEEPKIYIFPKSNITYEAQANEFTLASTLTAQTILQAKAQMHSSSFQAQMQQNPVSTQGQLIHASFFSYYKQDDIQNIAEMKNAIDVSMFIIGNQYEYIRTNSVVCFLNNYEQYKKNTLYKCLNSGDLRSAELTEIDGNFHIIKPLINFSINEYNISFKENKYYKLNNSEFVEVKEFYRYIITTDFATTDNEMSADYSVVACWGMNENYDIYLLDVERVRGGGLKVTNMFDSFIKRWGGGISGNGYLTKIFIENVTGSQSIIQEFQRKHGERLIEKIPRTKSKFPRFLEVGGFIENKKVFLPQQNVFIKGKSIQDMVRTLIEECENFRENETDYQNDDMVDVLFDACNYAKTPPKSNTFLFDEDLQKYMGND